jgi:hypothetical protein
MNAPVVIQTGFVIIGATVASPSVHVETPHRFIGP